MKARRQRMIFVGIILAGIVGATILAIMAIGENMLYFFSPSQVRAGDAPSGANFRVGGIVVGGSVRRPGDGLTVEFDLTDNAETITVTYTGILPDLFREGQGIVARGWLRDDGMFAAEEVLAKHDENYMPPEVNDSLKGGKGGAAEIGAAMKKAAGGEI